MLNQSSNDFVEIPEEHLFLVTATKKADGAFNFFMGDQRLLPGRGLRIASASLAVCEKELGKIIKSRRHGSPYSLRHLFLVKAVDDGDKIGFTMITSKDLEAEELMAPCYDPINDQLHTFHASDKYHPVSLSDDHAAMFKELKKRVAVKAVV